MPPPKPRRPTPPAERTPPADVDGFVDEIVVERLVQGQKVAATKAEREAAYALLKRRGLTASEIAERLRHPSLIGYREIAEISGRQEQTVRTWRLGEEGMPRPVEHLPSDIPNAPPSPQFDRDQVVLWLKQTLRLTPDGRPQFPRTPKRNPKTGTKTRRKPATKETR